MVFVITRFVPGGPIERIIAQAQQMQTLEGGRTSGSSSEERSQPLSEDQIEELKKYYVDTLKLMGKITYLATEYFAETEDVIIFKAVIASEGRGTVHADNGLYMKDGKIWRHIALTLLPDVDYDELGTRWTD